MKTKNKLLLTFIFLCCSCLVSAQNNYIDSLKQQLTIAKGDTSRVDLLSEIARFYMFFYPDTAENYARQGLELANKKLLNGRKTSLI